MASEENIGKLYRIAQQNAEEVIEYSNFRADLLRAINKDLDVDEVMIKMLEVSENQILGSYKNGIFVFSDDIMKTAEKLVREESEKYIEDIEQEEVVQTANIQNAEISGEKLSKMVSNFGNLTREERLEVISNFSSLTRKEQEIVVKETMETWKNAALSSNDITDEERVEIIENVQNVVGLFNFLSRRSELIEKYNDEGTSKEEKEKITEELITLRREEIEGLISDYYILANDEDKKEILAKLSSLLGMNENDVKKRFLSSEVDVEKNIDDYLCDLTTVYLCGKFKLDENGNPPNEVILNRVGNGVVFDMLIISNEHSQIKKQDNFERSTGDYEKMRQIIYAAAQSVDDEGRLNPQKIQSMFKKVPKIPVKPANLPEFVSTGLSLHSFMKSFSNSERTSEERAEMVQTAITQRTAAVLLDKKLSQPLPVQPRVGSDIIYKDVAISDYEIEEVLPMYTEELVTSTKKYKPIDSFTIEKDPSIVKQIHDRISFNIADGDLEKAKAIVARSKKRSESVVDKSPDESIENDEAEEIIETEIAHPKINTEETVVTPESIQKTPNTTIVLEEINIGEEKKDQVVEAATTEQDNIVQETLPKEITLADKMKQGFHKFGKMLGNMAKGMFLRITEVLNGNSESTSNVDTTSSSNTSSTSGPSVSDKIVQVPVDYLNTQYKLDYKQAVQGAKAAAEKVSLDKKGTGELTQEEEI